jgi:hypothetical protein
MTTPPDGLPRGSYLHTVQAWERGLSREKVTMGGQIFEASTLLTPWLFFIVGHRDMSYAGKLPRPDLEDHYIAGIIDECGRWVRYMGSMHSVEQAKHYAAIRGYLGREYMRTEL